MIMALALSVLIFYLNLSRTASGLKLGALAWAGFAFTIGLTGNMFSENMMGAILTAWR